MQMRFLPLMEWVETGMTRSLVMKDPDVRWETAAERTSLPSVGANGVDATALLPFPGPESQRLQYADIWFVRHWSQAKRIRVILFCLEIVVG